MYIKALILALVLSLLCDSCWAEDIDLNKISLIESSNNPLAYNSRTQATGLYQITPVCLADFSKHCDWRFTTRQLEMFTMENMFDEYYSHLVAKWYINERIPQMLKAYGIEDTVDARLACFNWGIGNYRKYLNGEKKLPHETKDYIRKYKEPNE